MHMRVPRLHVHRLVYVLMGAALAVGLLVSAIVRPEPMLAASVDCYGVCPSVTALSLSSPTVTYGNEHVLKFSVKVSPHGPGTGVPTGFVKVESGTKILCRVHLSGGKGTCSPAARALAPGKHTILGYYTGDSNFKPSTSNKAPLTVLRRSVTALSLSSPRVTYGNEHVLKFSVKVSAGAPKVGVPAGYAVVESGTKILCRFHLSGGKGTCSPAARALAPGKHTIAAHYTGGKTFVSSTSGHKTLTVLR